MLGLLILIALVAMGALLLVKIAPETRRFAVFVGGQFECLKGPGLAFKLPRSNVRWVPLTVGDRGTLAATNLAAFGDAQVPVEVSGSSPSSRIRIIGFKNSKVIVGGDD